MADKPRDLPRGPHRLTRDEVAASQRGRLLAAMAQLVADHGYANTTVADVIRCAGVSRKAFYAYFPNREACFLATCEMVIAAEMTAIRHASASRSTELQTEEAIALLFEQAAISPPLVRLALVEIRALGEKGSLLRERRLMTHEQILRRSLGIPVARKAGRSPLLRALVGGLNAILYDRASQHRSLQLPELIPEASSWLCAYRLPPQALRDAPRPRKAPRPTSPGGRAPGTLSPSPPQNKQRGLRGENTLSRSFVVHSQRERVLDAIATLSTENGYAAVTVKDIAEHAAISMETFYQHFSDKEDAFLVAYELGHSRALAITEDAYQSAPSWEEGVREAIDALFGFLAAEPIFAQMALREALLASPRISVLARKAMSAFTNIPPPGLESRDSDRHSHDRNPVLGALRGGVAELCLTYTTGDDADAIRDVVAHATYFVLAPFVGGEAAGRIARVGAARSRGRDT
jgi:AcrR family transcriptional regulator